MSFEQFDIDQRVIDGVKAMGRATLVGRIAEPDEMAASICAIADARLFGYTTGQIFACNGGMYMA